MLWHRFQGRLADITAPGLLPSRNNDALRRVPVLALPGLLAVLAASLGANPASAQIAGGVSVASEQEFRGYSLSAGRPVVTVDLSYDDASGFYLDGATTIVFEPRLSPYLLSAQANAGYALRTRGGAVLDFGIEHTEFTEHYSGRHSTRYTEFYVGIITHSLSSRLYFSPNYLKPGSYSVYGEVEGVIAPAPNWKLIAHIGLFQPLGGVDRAKRHYDARVGLSRSIRSLNLHASCVASGPRSDNPPVRRIDGPKFIVGADVRF